MAQSHLKNLNLSRRLALLSPSLLLAVTSAPAHARIRMPRLSLEDRAELQDLTSSFLWALDCSDEDGFIELFTADAMVVGLGRRYEDETAIRDWFRGLVQMRDTAGDAWLHEAGQFRFDGDGRTCVVYAYASHFRVNPASRELGVRSLGYFVNECVKTAGRWRFRRLSINRWDNHAQPWKKPKPWEAAADER